MKKFTRIIAVALSMLMVSSVFFGCSSNNTANSTSQQASSAKLSTIKVAYILFSNVPKDQQKVEDAINKITEKEINVKVNLVPINVSAYSQQINLMLSSNEKLDLFADGTITAFFNYTSHATKGQLYDMTDLLDKYGSGIKSSVGSYLSATKISGKVYGVPTIRDFAADTRIMMRKDLVDKYKIDYKNIKSTSDIEKVLATIKKNEPTITPLLAGANGNSTLFDSVGFSQNGDQLGDLIGVLEDNQVLKVTDYYESQNAKETATLARKWYNSGYLMKDASTSGESGPTLVKSGKLFAYLQNAKPGIDAQDSASAGYTLVSAEIGPALSDTQKVDGFMWAIPSYTTNAEASMKFLNLMYSDSKIVNLLDWGIENTHYTKVSGKSTVIDYPSGVTAKTTGYAPSVGFEFGNEFLSYTWKGDSETLWNDMKSFNNTAKKSKALGFMFDSTSVKTEYANVSNVVNQYKIPIGTGAVDPSQLQEFISKLKTAGIDKIVQAKQTQLDKWASSNS